MPPPIRALFLNRVSYSGRVVEGHTSFAAPKRWNIIATNVPEKMAEQLQGARLTNMDFEDVIMAPGEAVWVYCDPPYISDTLRSSGSRLYQHTFSMDDHERLAAAIENSPHQVTLSYDDHPIVRERYKDFWIHEATWGHCVSSKRSLGKELIITNFEVKGVDSQAGFGIAA